MERGMSVVYSAPLYGRRVKNPKSLFTRQSILWRVVGALVLGALLARWSWLLFAPASSELAMVPSKQATVEAGQLFGLSSGTAQDGGVVQPGAVLVGVFASSMGKPGFAVLKLGGQEQTGLGLGERTPSGAKLVEIHPDHVVLERGGARQRVDLEGVKASARPDAVGSSSR